MRFLHKHFDLDFVFDRLTIGTVSILTLITVLLLLSIVLYDRLRVSSEDTSAELLSGIAELQETTETLQQTVDTLSQLPVEDSSVGDELNTIERRLEEIDEALGSIEENIVEFVPLAEAAPPTRSEVPSTQEISEVRQSVSWIYVVITYLIGGLSIITAIVLILSVTTRSRRRRIE
jgi:hypothetical protein